MSEKEKEAKEKGKKMCEIFKFSENQIGDYEIEEIKNEVVVLYLLTLTLKPEVDCRR